ncbi:MAG: hypothetical protein EOO20_17590 [Chryseobacterium sp.]|nr:MAG: hypothetical protein EOO20_17590 [Chryseobacterium sp.]
MKTALDIIQDLRKLLLPIEPQLSGGKIRQYYRVMNNKANDVVINVQGADDEPMQFAIVNINIHTANLSLPITGGTDNTNPNLAVFNTLVQLIMPVVKMHVECSFKIRLRKDNGLIRDNDGSWYYNIQLNYYSMQEASVA